MTKFYRTLIVTEILSDRPVGNLPMMEIQNEAIFGDFSARELARSEAEVSPSLMRRLLVSQGSDADFLVDPEESDDY